MKDKQSPQPNREKHNITAILDAGMLTGKIKLARVEREIKIPVLLRVKNPFETMSQVLPTTSIMKFVWLKQISRFTHKYILEEIL